MNASLSNARYRNPEFRRQRLIGDHSQLSDKRLWKRGHLLHHLDNPPSFNIAIRKTACRLILARISSERKVSAFGKDADAILFLPKHEHNCVNVSHCPHLGGAELINQTAPCLDSLQNTQPTRYPWLDQTSHRHVKPGSDEAIMSRKLFILPALMLLSLDCPVVAQLIDDRAITIHSAEEIAGKRVALIQYIWGNDGFPKNRMPNVVANVTSPVKQLDSVERVDELRVDMAPGLEGLAYHFIPTSPNGVLVVVHHGHACSLDGNPAAPDPGDGISRTIKALVREGYGVLGVFMPHMRPGDCTGGHDKMFEMNTTGSPLKYFLEPTAIGLNYLKSHSAADGFPNYEAFHMVGLSGGGWTTTVYAAIDPTIGCSFPVAGTIPLYLRSGGSVGDREQFEPSFYSIAGYPDLYILGAHGTGRRQVQILDRRDTCCFGEAQHDAKATGMAYADAMREYEGRVRTALQEIGDASFRLEIDESAPGHMISEHAIEDVLLPELKNAR